MNRRFGRLQVHPAFGPPEVSDLWHDIDEVAGELLFVSERVVVSPTTGSFCPG